VTGSGLASSGCSVCGHPQVEAIDAALEGGTSVRDVTETWSGLSRSAVGRHKQNHPRPVPAGEVREFDPTEVLVGLQEHRLALQQRLRSLSRGGSPQFVAVSREWRSISEQIARLQADPEVLAGLTRASLQRAVADGWGERIAVGLERMLDVLLETFPEDTPQAISSGEGLGQAAAAGFLAVVLEAYGGEPASFGRLREWNDRRRALLAGERDRVDRDVRRRVEVEVERRLRAARPPAPVRLELEVAPVEVHVPVPVVQRELEAPGPVFILDGQVLSGPKPDWAQ
jgi:hypothetical protein